MLSKEDQEFVNKIGSLKLIDLAGLDTDYLQKAYKQMSDLINGVWNTIVEEILHSWTADRSKVAGFVTSCRQSVELYTQLRDKIMRAIMLRAES